MKKKHRKKTDKKPTNSKMEDHQREQLLSSRELLGQMQEPLATMSSGCLTKMTSMFHIFNHRGNLRFMLFESAFTTAIFLKFLKRLIGGSQEKVFLILDKFSVHHAKKLKPWLEENKDKIELIYLPAYSPELNTDELLNQDVKAML